MPTISSLDQLNEIDLTNVESSRPLLKEGLIKVKLHSMEIKDQKAPKTGKNLNIVLVTETSNPNREAGKPEVPSGYKHTETISLVTTDGYNPAERLAAVQECFLGVKGKFIPSELIGRVGVVRIKIESDKEFGDKNRVQTWTKKKSGDAPTLS